MRSSTGLERPRWPPLPPPAPERHGRPRGSPLTDILGTHVAVIPSLPRNLSLPATTLMILDPPRWNDLDQPPCLALPFDLSPGWCPLGGFERSAMVRIDATRIAIRTGAMNLATTTTIGRRRMPCGRHRATFAYAATGSCAIHRARPQARTVKPNHLSARDFWNATNGSRTRPRGRRPQSWKDFVMIARELISATGQPTARPPTLPEPGINPIQSLHPASSPAGPCSRGRGSCPMRRRTSHRPFNTPPPTPAGTDPPHRAATRPPRSRSRSATRNGPRPASP